MTDQTNERAGYQGPAFFSYGFRPLFLGAALFAGVAVPAWVLLLTGVGDVSAARQWHVHEMVFGFLPALITGFLLTATPHWTDRPPIRVRAFSFRWPVGGARRNRRCRLDCSATGHGDRLDVAGAGVVNLGRLLRWYGWVTWREPLVLTLHLGYGWVALSLLVLGSAIF